MKAIHIYFEDDAPIGGYIGEQLEDAIARVIGEQFGLSARVESEITHGITQSSTFMPKAFKIWTSNFVEWLFGVRDASFKSVQNKLLKIGVSYIYDNYKTISDLICELGVIPISLIWNMEELDLPEQIINDEEINRDNLEKHMEEWPVKWLL